MAQVKNAHIDDTRWDEAMEDLGREIDKLGKEKAAAMRVAMRHGLYGEVLDELLQEDRR